MANLVGLRGVFNLKIRDNALVLNENDLKMILVHIGFCAECVAYDTGKVEKMDFIEIFKEQLETNKWLNDFEDVEYKRLEIELNQ